VPERVSVGTFVGMLFHNTGSITVSARSNAPALPRKLELLLDFTEDLALPNCCVSSAVAACGAISTPLGRIWAFGCPIPESCLMASAIKGPFCRL